MRNRKIIIEEALLKLNSSGYVLDYELNNLYMEFTSLDELIILVKQAGYSGELLYGSGFFDEYRGYSPTFWLYDPSRLAHENIYRLAEESIKNHIIRETM